MLCWTATRVINTAFTFYLTNPQLILHIDDHNCEMVFEMLIVSRLLSAPTSAMQSSSSHQRASNSLVGIC